jgi:Sigma-70 region 2
MSNEPPTHFLTTRWTLVLHAARGEAEMKNQALEQLCQAYWKPVYAWLRRRGNSEVAAQDLTQDFFLRVVSRDMLGSIQQERGKFRTYLLTLVQRFAADEYDRSQAYKRGGQHVHISFDWQEAETITAALPNGCASPDAAYEKIAKTCGLTANYVSVSLLRWRRRVRELVMEELRDITQDEASAEAEFSALLAALRE